MATDYVQQFSDRKIAELERKIGKVYAQAAREVRQKLEAFNAGHAARAAQMRRDVEAGKITEQDYKDWLRGQVFQGRLWEQKLDEITRVYQNADREARRMVGDVDKTVFAEAANRQAYETERALSGGGRNVQGGVSFNLYDQTTVDRLTRDDPQILPEWRINEPKDYRWNEGRVRNAVTQGIIQGESVQKIGARLTSDLAARNAGKMEMFARTAVTGASNAGRVERMHEAEEKYGIKSKKRWLSVHDDRVRDTHAELDGQTVDPDEPFVLSDGRTIRFPGDPEADADLVYNCRCTLLYIPATGPEGDYSLESHHLPQYQAYNEWKEGRQKEKGLNQSGESGMIQPAGSVLNQEGNGSRYPAAYDGDFSDYQPLTLSTQELERLDTLHQSALQTGHEHGMIEADGFVSEPFTSDIADGVYVPEKYRDLPHLNLSHSHTNATTLSGGDFRWLTRPNVDSISVDAINGDVFRVRVGTGYRPTVEEYNQDLREITRQANEYIMDYPDYYEWTPEEKLVMAVREQAVLIVRHYGWVMEGGRP